jgi:hypothetical protein
MFFDKIYIIIHITTYLVFIIFYGDYSSVVECLIVDQKVMGSIPINYPQILV